MGRRNDGHLAGYRDEVRQGVETIPGVPSKRWDRGYEEGKEQAREDLKFREELLRGLEELNAGGASLAVRQAAVRLVIADALRWTDPTTLNNESFPVLAEGLDLLGRASFSEDDEEAWITCLLEAGWFITPPRSEVNQGAEAA